MSLSTNKILNRIKPELEYQAVKSSGPGGQHVNKTNTKVVLRWDVLNSKAITEDERRRFLIKLKTFINNDGVLYLTDQSTKSQLKNKRSVTDRLIELIEKANYIPKRRVRTKPTKSSVIKRLEAKRRLALKKQNRNKLD